MYVCMIHNNSCTVKPENTSLVRCWNCLEDYGPCTGGVSDLSAVGAQLFDLINLETDPMAVGSINKWAPSRKAGGIP